MTFCKSFIPLVLGKDKKEIFDKYSEKVIERTYAITERAESVGGTMAMMAREGFCFYIFHQPKLPEAFREKE